jgi:hypothetical protein
VPYEIWLSWNNQQEGFQLPVNPGSLELSDGNTGKEYDIVGQGTVNVIKNPKLTSYSFSSFFPAPGRQYHFAATNQLLTPKRYVELLTKWMASKRPIRFVFIGGSFNISEPVSIEGFDWKEDAGGAGDVEYTLKLKKYVFYSAKRVTVQLSDAGGEPVISESTPQRPDDRIPPATHTIEAGDTLWLIAQQDLGDGSRWGEIQVLNGLSDAQVKSLTVGTVLQLPESGGVALA